MKKPTFLDFLIRVGGLAALVVIAVQLTKAFMPGYEAKVVAAISLAVIVGTSIRTYIQRSKKSKNSGSDTNNYDG